MPNRQIAIIGTVGIPANYGGFETLAENLVKYHHSASSNETITVYCSSNSYTLKTENYNSAKLHYIPLNANGIQSIPYDIWSMLSAIFHRNDVILLLGVSGAIALPLVRLLTSAKIVTNIDGMEWRRQKWQGLAKHFLRFSEKMAVRFSDVVIADNAAIAEYVVQAYDVLPEVIAYGGDHAVEVEPCPLGELVLPDAYALSVCRIEPENNVHLVLDAFSRQDDVDLVVVGNWNNSAYGQALRDQYQSFVHLHLLDPVYDLGKLKTLRSNAAVYVHGHCAGGTNPSLVEAMHFGKAVFAFDCSFNRVTTEGKALYFSSAAELAARVASTKGETLESAGMAMKDIATRRYTWQLVAKQYFDLM